MQTQPQSSPGVIKDLIVINNDRYEGYKTAAEETQDSELKSLFTEFSNQSRGFGDELKRLVPSSENIPKSDETKNSGKVYRAWMDIKAAVTGKDRKAILGSCEFGEDVAKKHYEDALKNTEGLSSDAMNVVRKQSDEIRKAHDRVKAMRDAAK
jgi:uncharacterized protein (TIGR02284 family)